MKKGIVYLIILGILCFISGIGVGIVFEKYYTQTHLPQVLREHFKKHPKRLEAKKEKTKRFQERFLKKLDQNLALSPEQEEKIRTILEESRKALKEKTEILRKELARIKEESKNKILENLTPEQKEKFKELLNRLEGKTKRFKKRF